MADARFYDNQGPFTIGDLARGIGAALADGTDPALAIIDVGGTSDLRSGVLGYLSSHRAAEGLALSAAGAWLTSPKLAARLGLSGPMLLHDNPAAGFAEIAHRFYPRAGRNLGAGREVAIDPTARIGDGVTLEYGAVIGPGAEIGDASHISAYAVVGRGVCLGRGCYVGPHASLAYTLAGDRVSIFAGARLGNDGFGFTPSVHGLTKVPQLGRVIIQDDVEIGANCTIDRGALGDTVIGEGSKLDNAVHIAHNCVIGRHVVLAGQVGMAGSVTVGDGVFMGGQVGVGDHLTIGPGARLAAKTGVGKDLPGGQAYGGTPARPIMQWRRETGALTRLVKRMRTKDDE